MARLHRRACALLAVGWVGAIPAPDPAIADAAPVIASVARSRCAFGAFVRETDPAGLNVRDRPHKTGTILGKLPPVTTSVELQGYRVMIEVEVAGTDHGWFEITHARDNSALTGRPERRIFAGRGWVSGRQLTVKTQARQGRARPDADSPVVFSLSDGSSLDTEPLVANAHLVACQGPWALVEFSRQALSPELDALIRAAPEASAGLPEGRLRAWVDQVCAIQETACDAIGESP